MQISLELAPCKREHTHIQIQINNIYRCGSLNLNKHNLNIEKSSLSLTIRDYWSSHQDNQVHINSKSCYSDSCMHYNCLSWSQINTDPLWLGCYVISLYSLHIGLKNGGQVQSNMGSFLPRRRYEWRWQAVVGWALQCLQGIWIQWWSRSNSSKKLYFLFDCMQLDCYYSPAVHWSQPANAALYFPWAIFMSWKFLWSML